MIREPDSKRSFTNFEPGFTGFSFDLPDDIDGFLNLAEHGRGADDQGDDTDDDRES
jgi:hypothetical protein